MKSRILAFEKVLYGNDFDDPDEGWTKYLDIDSAVDFYIAKEFTKENDSDFYRSTFFYIPDYTSPSSKVRHGPDLGLRPQRRRQARCRGDAGRRSRARRGGGCAATARSITAPRAPTGTSSCSRTPCSSTR